MDRFKLYIYRSNVKAAKNIIGPENDIFREAGQCFDLELVSESLQLRAQVHELDKADVPVLPPSFDSNETFGILEQSKLEAKQRERRSRMAEAPDLLTDAQLQDVILRCAYKKVAKEEVLHLVS